MGPTASVMCARSEHEPHATFKSGIHTPAPGLEATTWSEEWRNCERCVCTLRRQMSRGFCGYVGAPAQHHALDWLARRHAGESAALIASRARLSEATVINATKAYGPFPRPSHQVGRTTVTDEHHLQRVQDWIEQRRRGRSTADIAREYGVSHQIVSRSTLGHGPFPSKDTLAAWVTARRQRRTLHDIAQEYQVPPRRIGHHTAAAGPYPAPVGHHAYRTDCSASPRSPTVSGWPPPQCCAGAPPAASPHPTSSPPAHGTCGSRPPSSGG
jgi:hypothetical protein